MRAALAALILAAMLAMAGCGGSSVSASVAGSPTSCPGESAVSLGAEQRKADADARWMTAVRTYSRRGLIYAMSGKGGRGWTRPEAIYAADLLCLDWSEEAAKRAGEIQEVWMKTDSSASETRLERVLLKEGFTTDEARYGAVEAVG
jgi:hypothetical protein